MKKILLCGFYLNRNTLATTSTGSKVRITSPKTKVLFGVKNGLNPSGLAQIHTMNVEMSKKSRERLN